MVHTINYHLQEMRQKFWSGVITLDTNIFATLKLNSKMLQSSILIRGKLTRIFGLCTILYTEHYSTNITNINRI